VNRGIALIFLQPRY